ncbi:major facilitator superfamily transporter [Phlyctema vagabunda]|uniref:Major facilitator superfamily transporter n=1 Tax=Phlyctema vagabunda TaxID=108571 RepID=A0ABR4P7T0_9HELO
MATSDISNEKAQPKTADDHPESLSNSESNDLALLALEKRVLRKTDMVVLPMMCFVFFFQCEHNNYLSGSALLIRP